MDITAPWRAAAVVLSVGVIVAALVPLVPFPTRAGSRILRACDDDRVFLLLVAAVLLAYRYPSITTPALLNADEAQMTAQAITMVHHPIPWRDYDTTTSGPLDTLVLLLPELVRHPPTLATSRAVGALLQIGALAFGFGALRRTWGVRVARVAILAPLFLAGGAVDGNYVQYASEYLSLALLAFAAYLLALAATVESPRRSLLLAAGCALGAIPFAKLQVIPLALVLVAAFGSIIVVRRARGAWFAAGLAIVPVLVMTIVAAAGALDDFMMLYLLFPRAYLAGNAAGAWAAPAFFFADRPFGAFFCLAIVAALALAAVVARSDGPGRRALLAPPALVVGALAIAAIFAIEAPRTPFVHYLLLALLPATGILAVALAELEKRASRARLPAGARAALFASVALATTAPLFAGSLVRNPYTSAGFRAFPADPVVERLRRHVHPGDRVAMWGWAPQYLVDTRAEMGTRDAISQFEIEERPFKAYYRANYLAEFRANRPRFLIEAIGPSTFAYHDRRTQGIHAFPDLEALVAAHYRTVFDFDGVRLFERASS